MKVFVVIVTYNPAKWIDQCFSSLRASTIPVQTIVIDNNSTDGSNDLIKKNFPEINLIESAENLGFGKANNIGIKKAYESGADYVLLLNQDAWVENDSIKKMIDYQMLQPDFDMVSPMHLDGTGHSLDYNFSAYLTPKDCKGLISDIYLNQLKTKLYEIKFVNAACWLLTRTCIETVGGFNPLFYHYGEDNNYLDRLHFHKMKLGLCPVSKIYHDREQINTSTYFNKDVQQKRSKLLKYVDPNNPGFVDSEISAISKSMFYHFLTLRLRKVIELNRERNELKNKRLKFSENIKLSSQKGLTFL